MIGYAMILAAVAHGPASRVVVPGDTLSGIAASAGVSLASVEAANPQIANPDLIYAGQAVTIPGGGGSAGGQVVTVTAGGGSGDDDDSGAYVPRHASAAAPDTGAGTYGHHRHHHRRHSGGYASSGGSYGYSSSDLADIPGVPRSFAACVAFRESSNGANQAYNGGVYGIINASGEHVNGQSLAAQKAAFARLYQRYGTSPWTPSDHC